ncbi:signal transduction histidine kinase [Breoghania corrubedonensis]|uniref:histidine kinase n=1 Tax=Breoghania corrubedonensis TaxID=665038 RepID=A0A2T5V7L1_9HYPH|nr:HAMP domain-containing sensor histidine kinase [Breoghania corrubedonensis]PTW59721.1 signal transduction histidine kinase [Breoghania corrubedonensis]
MRALPGPSSLRARLLVFSAVIVVAALALSAFGLIAIFTRQYETRIDAELDTFITQLVAAVSIDAQGTVELDRDLADPRFSQPLSGLYWSITATGSGQVLRSRSLWDATLPLPSDELSTGAPHRHEIVGPGREKLIVRERLVTHPAPSGAIGLRVAVAIDAGEIAEARRDYTLAILPSLALLALALIAAAAIQTYVGLRPLRRLERDVAKIRDGRAQTLPGNQPDEVMPLIDAVNDLLGDQEKAISHARARAADLAHGLKTPLTVLASLAARLRREGAEAAAGDIETVASDMRRQIEHQLVLARIRTRAHGRSAARTELRPQIDRLVRTLKQTPDGEALDWQIAVKPGATLAIDVADLLELLGNLLDNAVKWATHRIEISMPEADGLNVLEIADDGPGMSEEDLTHAFRRGVRLDEHRPGHGFGLAIVEEICEANGIAVTLRRRGEGGLAVRLEQARG